MKNLLIIGFLFVWSISSAQAQTVEIKNLKLNDELSQYGVVYQRDNKVFYSRYKLNDFGSVDKNRMGQTIFTLYEGELTGDNEIINTKEWKSSDAFTFNSSTAAFSKDGKYMYVTTNEEKRGDVYKHTVKKLGIYESKEENMQRERVIEILYHYRFAMKIILMRILP